MMGISGKGGTAAMLYHLAFHLEMWHTHTITPIRRRKNEKTRIVPNRWKTIEEIPPRTELSDAISKDMKRRGFKFFGSTICYAHLQATGLVNDHLLGCPARGDSIPAK